MLISVGIPFERPLNISFPVAPFPKARARSEGVMDFPHGFAGVEVGLAATCSITEETCSIVTGFCSLGT